MLRYFFPYGQTDKNRLINRLINKIKNNEIVELNVDGKPIINPVTVQDAAKVTIATMKPLSEYNVFNIGGSETVSILQLMKIIEEQLGMKARITYNNHKIENMVGDITKAKELLSFKPEITLERGIEDILKEQA